MKYPAAVLGFFVDIYNMCGIAGIFLQQIDPVSIPTAGGLNLVKKMARTLAHRGPDGEGYWTNKGGNIFLGHRRLAITDLTLNATQPMHFTQEKVLPGGDPGPHYSIVHNGEIYNHIELRKILQQKGYTFHSHSDTEVILASYDHWKEKCIQYFEGMFAFAIWDEKEQQIFAARDRFGEKPFYYFEDKEHFIFASEMKALWAAGVPKVTDDKMLLNYLALGHVQNSLDKEQSFFENVYSLPPAHYLFCSRKDFRSKIHRYWSINKEITIDIGAEDAIGKFTELFNSSIKRRLRSDVIPGSCLSGGLDSSSIIASIAGQKIPGIHSPGTDKKLKTFSAVFPQFERDESKYIDTVIKRFGVDNFRIAPTAEGLVHDFDRLCFHQDEPFPTTGIYAQFKVFELASEHQVKVLLDGQGADEILAGYPRYIHWFLQEVLNQHKLGAATKEKKNLRKNGQVFKWDIRNIFAAFLPAHAALQLEKREYRNIKSQPDINPEFSRSLSGREWEGIHKPIVNKLNDILYFNTTEMGLEELLRFADRNSMAHGIETRFPFLDHELVEFIFSLPSRFKIHEGWTKWLLRKSMDKQMPDTITWRGEKTGYETPQRQWMENKLMQELIQEARKKLVTKGILKKSVLQKQIQPREAYAGDNYDWRYLCAAKYI